MRRYVRTILHVKLEQKVEREQVAKVTGTNKDDTGVREPKKRAEKKYIQTIHARAEAERNTNSAADGRINFRMQTYMI